MANQGKQAGRELEDEIDALRTDLIALKDSMREILADATAAGETVSHAATRASRAAERAAYRAPYYERESTGLVPWEDQQHSDLEKLNSIMERVLQANERQLRAVAGDDPVFNFDSDDFDGLAALRRMNRDLDEAIARGTVVLEDTQRFIEGRKLKS